MSLDPTRFRVLTFDCYGTLIDWDGGIRASLSALPSLAGCDLERMIADRERIEAELEAGPYRPYGEILADSLRGAAVEQERTPTDAELADFATSMERWPPFHDSHDALLELAERYRLAILSNVEKRVLKKSVALLDAPFELLVTAGDVRSYKPARAHFDEGLRRLGLSRGEVLHVAGSLFHDVRPVTRLGWTAAWIDRRGEGNPPGVEHVFPDLAALTRALR